MAAPNDHKPDHPPSQNNDPLNPTVIRRGVLAILTATTTFFWLLTPTTSVHPANGDWLSIYLHTGLAPLPAFLLFIPYGVSAGWLSAAIFPRRTGTLILLAFDTLLLALVVESAQYWLSVGQSSCFDLIAHTLGGTTGACLGMRMPTSQHSQDSGQGQSTS